MCENQTYKVRGTSSYEQRKKSCFSLTKKSKLASQVGALSRSPSRSNQCVDEETVQSLEAVNQAYLDRLHVLRPSARMVLDVDSSNFETFGNQEGSAYNV
ncbi:transposase [Sporolactobacillus sp. THM19-2]|uniref:transposase n=1 Tax=Sporolactobacillus sp. THM19-2 TaxID=2511171 RepID=UPI001020B813|nr:transposase [Sporolactobacillus sp. THM19-2]RYL92597.1 hypothetical protein EWH91_06970 [Sporolactobacillus sp. THM19-2]